MENFIEFGEGKAMMLNNADWLCKLNYIELLREVGRVLLREQHAAGRVLQAAHGKGPQLPGVQLHDHAVLRLLSHVPDGHGCNMQFGGDDQWSNMLGGTELIRGSWARTPTP
jgi:tyrosyl-tRNA synthetase